MSLDQFVPYVLSQPLFTLAVMAIAAVVVGGLLRTFSPMLGGLVGTLGNIGLFAALLLTVSQVIQGSHSVNFASPALGVPQQEVIGRETRVPIARDGHFWIRANINGVSQPFLVDTGATLTAVSPEIAEQTNLQQRPMREPIMMRTANGTVSAELATIDELRFGNIVASNLDAVIAPGMEGTNVLGMNFLSRLAGWRVEGQTLILTPHHPQTAAPEI